MKYAGVRWWNERKGEGERERRGAETLDGEMGLWSEDLQEAGELVSSVPGDSTWGFRAQRWECTWRACRMGVAAGQEAHEATVPGTTWKAAAGF